MKNEDFSNIVGVPKKKISPFWRKYLQTRHCQTILYEVITSGFERSYSIRPKTDRLFLDSITEIASDRALLREKIIQMEEELKVPKIMPPLMVE